MDKILMGEIKTAPSPINYTPEGIHSFFLVYLKHKTNFRKD
jgi:hypothetical protein